MRRLMTGNEAVARGAYESGVLVAAAYPGTPSTEILENVALYDEIYSEWAPNEKVALEVVIGASIAGVRTMAAMKHVGVNVAADPLFTAAYTGVTGGLLLVSADDPGMHSSQNEQDNRSYSKFAKIAMLEPSDSQEAKDFVSIGLSISEEYNIPVMLRMTTRLCHSKSIVDLEARKKVEPRVYEKNIKKYVATPANSRSLRVDLEDRQNRLRRLSGNIEINKIEWASKKIGVISSGVAYQYAREAFGDDVSYMKLGMTNPLPIEYIRSFADQIDKLYVVEELEPFIEDQLKAAGIECIGKEVFGNIGELNSDKVAAALNGRTVKEDIDEDIKTRVVPRPPAMCSGCPHRGVFYSLSRRKNIMVTGDIGCYTLGSAEPLSAMDTCICMGASISAGHGASKAFEMIGSDVKVVSVIGDSTFFHSGITGLMDIVYNKGNSVSIILDNRITGMTGHQENPGTGYTIKGDKTEIIDIAAVCSSLGVKAVYEVNPYNLSEFNDVLDQALSFEGPSVVIAKYPCVLKKLSNEDKAQYEIPTTRRQVDEELCKSCRLCLKTGCPAISISDKAHIDIDMCRGCGICAEVCGFKAIIEVGGDS